MRSGGARVAGAELTFHAAFAVALTMVAVVLEAAALHLTRAPGERLAPLLAHLAAAVLTGTATREMADKRRAREGSFWMGFAAALLFFPFGVLGSLVLGRAWCTVRPRQAVSSWKARREVASQGAREARRKAQSCGRDVDPIIDALEDRDPNVRVAAVDALRGEVSPRVVRTLFRARENDVFEVRVRALEAIERIQREFVDRLRAAEAGNPSPASAARSPAERPAGNPKTHFGALCLEWASLGLEDPARVRADLARAREAGLRALAASPGDLDAAMLTAEAASRLGASHETLVYAAKVLAKAPDHLEARLRVAETFFRERRFGELAEACVEVKARCSRRLDSSSRGAVELWARGGSV